MIALSLDSALPQILATFAAVACYGLTRGRSARLTALGTVGAAALLALAAVLALWALASIGIEHFQASYGRGLLKRLSDGIDAVADVLFSGRLHDLLLIGAIPVAVVLLILFSNEIRKAWRALFPSTRVAADGPWRGSFLPESEISDLLKLKQGIPLGLTSKGRIVRYAKDDARGWLGGHHAVISATRGGKGVSAIIPAIFDHAGPVVAIDIKGELVDTTRAKRIRRGQKVVALDPFRTSETSRIEGQEPVGFNPMAFIRSTQRARDAAVLADGLVMPESGNAAHFSDRARACLQTVIEVVHELEEKPTLHEVRRIVLADDFPDILQGWLEKPQLAGGRAAELAGSFLAMGDKERGAILSTVAKSLEWTAADAMRGFLGVEEGLDLQGLLNGDADVFIVVPLDQVGPQAGFMRLMANLLLALMVQQNERQPATKPILLVADEFTRLGYLARVVDMATVAAGIGLEALFVLQDKGSLEAVYGDQAADTILGSCATIRIFNLGRGDSRTAEWASKLAGFQTLRTQSLSTSTGTTTTNATSAETKEPLLSASDILEVPTDQMICFIRGRPPIRLTRVFWYRTSNYMTT